VFQSYALFPHMTAAENVAFGLEMRKVPASERGRRVSETLELVGLGAFASRFPRKMSGGQQQRVALARALVIRPRILLLDEPLSNLDAKLRVQMRLEIKRLQRELDVTSIYVTHDQVEAMTLADRLIVMNAGVADQIGTPMDVYERPASVFVAGFIGSPAMNFLAGKVVEGGQAIELAGTGSVRVVLPIGLATTATAGMPVAVGIRPEHLHPAADGPLEFEIELAEPLGADTLLHGRFGEASEVVTVRQSGHILAKPGVKLRFKADPGHLHLFDSQTGKRIPDAA
jgi:sn-glycerol 3-phosphate transport system ATP-binding protein